MMGWERYGRKELVTLAVVVLSTRTMDKCPNSPLVGGRLSVKTPSYTVKGPQPAAHYKALSFGGESPGPSARAAA